ncbi:glycosyl transferase group 1 [Anaeromyxobacter dehalogenans 2CP-1]|uniref:Glycosyl transferase group 1 n=1 Tax=Anaeromyxobacter dehalogenans (strain ATCC BAA-258 / DSM 21875 / 2CP-1) TaxID=455488 RepID=B8JCX5_ANAD2|nr:glycosyltransferase [Anaeromyxobacter dehalogenans]ACL64003.1 glycosyl transferase group 1 [Anaeromyxobacter dehalogenans 2CP-1]
MRVVHVSTSDSQGGAARAALRLHRGLRDAGVDSSMLVRERFLNEPEIVRLRGRAARLLGSGGAVAERVTGRLYPHHAPVMFGASWVPDLVAREVRALRPDVVNVHWVGAGFVTPESIGRLARRGPLVWTLHDTYPFTGGCHYFGDCEAYAARCGACPALGSRAALDLSRVGWLRKWRALRRAPLVAVAPSRWMADAARRSSLLRDAHVEVIPNSIDTDVFRPIERSEARRALGLPLDRRMLLFAAASGANDPKKGFQHLAAAARILAANGGLPLELVVAGTPPAGARPDCGVPVRWLGVIGDDRALAAWNAAVDVAVVPSVQENLANTVLEALAAGTPAVAFRVGGMPDMIEDRVSGALAEPFDPRALADAIRWVVEDRSRHLELSAAARRRAESEYALAVQARRYRALYEDLLRSGGRSARTASAKANG